MNKTALLLAATIGFATGGFTQADSIDGPEGKWPKTWPRELEPLRRQASTWVGGVAMNTRHEIPFTNRESFESAWPHILSLKSKGASITLLDGRHYYQNSDKTAGVMILPPLEGISSGSLSVTRLVVMVDGDIIDLNRIRLPADTPIDDRRFKNRIGSFK